MCARDWPGPCVYCSAHTFGKRDKHIRNSGFSSLHLLHLPLASPSPSRRRSSAVCSSFLHLCPGFFLFRGLLSVALRAAELPALGCSPVLFSVSVPRWQPSHSPAHHLLLFATHICKPFCGHFCSVVLSVLCRPRPCFLRFPAVLFSTPFSCRDGSPDISPDISPCPSTTAFFCGATGKTLSSSIPWTRQVVFVLNRTKMHAGNSFQICFASWLAPPTASAGQTQPTISPAHPRKIPRLRSKWSAAATGIPMHSGKTPYKDPQSWSCRCSHVNFSFPKSGFSRKAALDILSFAMAWCSTCPVSAAQALARSLFTWYFTAFVAKIVFAPEDFPAASMGPSATLALDWRSRLHTLHSKRRIASGAAFSSSNFWHLAWLHSSVCPFQLPGTAVAKPRKNAWFASDNAPFRTSFCRLCNHISWVRLHSTSSVTPWIPSWALPQINSCPWMVWATFFDLHCVNHSHGTSPKKVPRGGGSCHISPARITFNPPKGRAHCASIAYLLWARSRTNSRQRSSNRAKSSALTMLISSIMSHRHRNALALNSSSLCPLMRSSPRPCQFKPNAWWIVSPFKSLAITACSVTTWNSAPCFQPKISSNNSFRIRFNTYDFPVPGPPCTAHRNGSGAPQLSRHISCMTWPATFLQTSVCFALHPFSATSPTHSLTLFFIAVILTLSFCTSGSRMTLSCSQLTGCALHRTLLRSFLLSKPWHGFGNAQGSHGIVCHCVFARSMASTMRLRCTDHLPFFVPSSAAGTCVSQASANSSAVTTKSSLSSSSPIDWLRQKFV